MKPVSKVVRLAPSILIEAIDQVIVFIHLQSNSKAGYCQSDRQQTLNHVYTHKEEESKPILPRCNEAKPDLHPICTFPTGWYQSH
jgi:hypothetical protein